MPLKKFFLFIAITAAISSSETINISGAVVDSAGKGIAGAEVLLEKANLSTQTDASGLFTLTGTVGISEKKRSFLPVKDVPFIQNARLNFTLGNEAAVAMTVYSFQGRVVYKKIKMMGAGTHVLEIPVLGDGVFLCRVKIGSVEYCVRGTFLRNSSGSVYGGSVVKMGGVPTKLAKKTAVIDDILSIRKEGFLDYRITVSESVMEMPVMRMIVNAGNLTDVDGNVYQTVRIGSQVWMTENLRVTKYKDGSPIPFASSEISWRFAKTPEYCYYGNTTNADSIKKFGALYNWYVVNTANTKKIAPSGWHVPNCAEWDILQNFLIANGYNWDGTTTGNKIAKAMSAKTDWKPSSEDGNVGKDLSTNNSCGFSALPGSFRYDVGNFYHESDYGVWWCTTEYDETYAYSRRLGYFNEYLHAYFYYKSNGFSVRLVKD